MPSYYAYGDDYNYANYCDDSDYINYDYYNYDNYNNYGYYQGNYYLEERIQQFEHYDTELNYGGSQQPYKHCENSPIGSEISLNKNHYLKVFLNDIDYEIDRGLICEIFNQYGSVVNINQLSLSVFIVQFKSQQEAVEAAYYLEGCNVYKDCCFLHIELATSDLHSKYQSFVERLNWRILLKEF